MTALEPIQDRTYYAETAADQAMRPPLRGELDVDVCVIGGGLAGLTAAREIARRGWSVVVLEARRIAGAASGRNTGFVIPGFATDLTAIAERVGSEDARELWSLSERGLDYVRDTIRSLRLRSAAMTPGGWLHVSKVDDEDRQRAYAETLSRDFGVTALGHWPRERVLSVLKSPLYFGALHYERGFSIHPLNYALGLAEAAEAAGARIFEQTPAEALDPAGVRKRIVTPDGRIRAAHVVLAGNIQADRLLATTAGTLVPITTYVVVTSPLGERLTEAVATKAAVSDTDLANNHYRVVEDGRLMWSGRSTVWPGDPRRYVRALQDDMARAFPQLGPVGIDFAWRGTLANTTHRMPQIGETMPGVWVLSGFGGHGLNTTAMGGALIASAITDGDTRWRLFTSFPLVWAGGLVGRAAAQVYSYAFDRRERRASKQAFARAGSVLPAVMLSPPVEADEAPAQDEGPASAVSPEVADAAQFASREPSSTAAKRAGRQRRRRRTSGARKQQLTTDPAPDVQEP